MMNATNFRYALGTTLVLKTSASLVLDQLQDERDERERSRQDEGDDGIMTARIAYGFVEAGECIGRSEFLKDGEPVEGHYMLRYRDGSGRQREDWFVPDALTTFEAIEEQFEREQAAAEAPSEPPVAKEPDVELEPNVEREPVVDHAPEGC